MLKAKGWKSLEAMPKHSFSTMGLHHDFSISSIFSSRKNLELDEFVYVQLFITAQVIFPTSFLIIVCIPKKYL